MTPDNAYTALVSRTVALLLIRITPYMPAGRMSCVFDSALV